MIFYFLSAWFLALAQQDSISAWQEQVLLRLDPDEFSESYYARLMEMLGDLELSRADTLPHSRLSPVRSTLIMRSDLRLDRQQQENAYLGDVWNHTVRYKLDAGKDWRAGVVMNKDAGERFRRKPPYFDSFSGYVVYRNTILGHYRLRLGSGLILNQQFSLGKSISSEMFMTSGTRLSPHSSTDEYSYMQGAATDLSLGKFRLLPFVSFKRIDAAIKSDTITSIPTDGYHRTAKEESKRNAAAVLNAGLHAGVRAYWFEIGASVLYTRFSHPYFRSSRAYNIYYYRGRDLLQGSIDYHLRRYGFALRGETAFDQNLNLATILQVSHALGEDWKAALLVRHYNRRYQQLYASSVAEGSAMQGEQGAMLSIQGEPLPHWKLNLMFDYFRFQNPQYGFTDLHDGFDFRTQALYSRRTLDLNISYRLKSKNSFRHNLDAVLAYGFSNGFKLKTQAKGKIFSSKEKGGYCTGYAVAQALIYAPDNAESSVSQRNQQRRAFSCELQAAYFDAEEYDARLYLSERNVLYGFGIPMLYGHGVRGSLTATYRFSPRLTLDAKYSIQKVPNRNRSNLWLQLRVKM